MQVPHFRPTIVRLAILAASAAVACSSDDPYGVTPPPGQTPANRTVQALPSIAFSPGEITIGVGDTVTFAFGSVPHNVYFDRIAGAPADVPGSNTNTSATRTFATAGRYTYTCHIHPDMHGTIVVAAGSTSGGPGY
jgi:plastocyanin